MFQSTPPMQGATSGICILDDAVVVSIHAPYAGSDCKDILTVLKNGSFNPRPLCRERHNPERWRRAEWKFQSTPPMQGATVFMSDKIVKIKVSIHAPYAGSDQETSTSMSPRSSFQSTPPMQGATKLTYSDIPLFIGFNPRPLCRERRLPAPSPPAMYGQFQSTPPMQGATRYLYLDVDYRTVSIHAPYAGSDLADLLAESG